MKFTVDIESKFNEGDTVNVIVTDVIGARQWPTEFREHNKGKAKIISVQLNWQYQPRYLCEFSNGERSFHGELELEEVKDEQ